MSSKVDEVTSDYVERHESVPTRRQSIDCPVHSEQPVWEQGRTYGPAGRLTPAKASSQHER